MAVTIRPATGSDLDALTEVTLDCVHGGASIGFMLPLPRETAARFWGEALTAMGRGERTILVAEDASGRVVGTVSLVLRMPDNQRHRADVAKMQVHRSARGQGVGMALLRAIETAAGEAGRSLLVLDTVTDSPAERLYRRAGWVPCGIIPDYAHLPGGGLCSTTFFYRRIIL